MKDPRKSVSLMNLDWLFEIKWDGFRVLLYSDNGVWLVSELTRRLLFGAKWVQIFLGNNKFCSTAMKAHQ